MRRLYTWFSTGKSRPVDESTRGSEDVDELRKRVHRLEIAFGELVDQHEATRGQLNRLRGRMYGGHRNDQEGGAGAIPYGDKDKLRAYAGVSLVRRPPADQE